MIQGGTVAFFTHGSIETQSELDQDSGGMIMKEKEKDSQIPIVFNEFLKV